MILVVDDDVLMRRAIARLLSQRYAVIVAGSIEEARALFSPKVATVLSDFDLGGEETGGDFLEEVQRIAPETRRVIMSGGNLARLHELTANGVAHALIAKGDLSTDRVYAAV